MAYAIQNSRDKTTLGSKAPWYAVWKDRDGKKHSLRVGAKRDALDIARERERQAMRAVSGLIMDKPWSDFRKEYESIAFPKMRSVRSQDSARQAMNQFEKIVNPKLVQGISRIDLDRFVAARRKMPGKKGGDLVSAETIKKELRTIRAALSTAREWGYLMNMPSAPKVDGFGREKHYVTPEHFNAILAHCCDARFPANIGYPAEWWWDALLSLLWVAPNRISAALALHWENIDLEAGTVTTRAEDNKQKRHHRACIPGVVVEKLKRIKRFDPRVFPWNHGEVTLYREFFRLQENAGIKLPCTASHEHTTACHRYGFHDFRRSFATLNGELPVAFQQNQMGHASFQTTMLYVKYGETQRSYADRLYLPESLKPRVQVAAGV